MTRGTKPVWTTDCETDPFLHQRDPRPFMWGIYTGNDFIQFIDNDWEACTRKAVEYLINNDVVVYAHNGGKFDFIYFMPFLPLDVPIKTQIINGRIVKMKLGRAELRDSYSIIPESMKNIQKEDIQMWKLERAVRQDHMDEIIFRNKTDCIYLYDLVKAYRDVAGNKTTIAANALSYAKGLGIDPGRTNHCFDDKMRKFFFGGRTECWQPGRHKNFKMIDIHSAYPDGMMHNHATGPDVFMGSSLDGLTREEIQRAFIVIECQSNKAFPIRIKDGSLDFPTEYNEFHVTGWEYIAAKELGLISNEKIHSVASFADTINFRDYVTHWYEYKESHPKKDDPIHYTIGKIMMNSLYGKLAQNPARYYDYIIHPSGTPIDAEHGWALFTENERYEFHRRESLWKYKYELGAGWETKPIYNNVATGASITGYVRAKLLRTIAKIGYDNVIYCDTDSIYTREGADLSDIVISPALGDWGVDDECAPLGIFLGKKLYAVRHSFLDKKTGKPAEKIATKGGRLEFRDFEKMIRGETVKFKNDAPTYSIDGGAEFLVRNIRATSRNFKPETEGT